MCPDLEQSPRCMSWKKARCRSVRLRSAVYHPFPLGKTPWTGNRFQGRGGGEPSGGVRQGRTGLGP